MSPSVVPDSGSQSAILTREDPCASFIFVVRRHKSDMTGLPGVLAQQNPAIITNEYLPSLPAAWFSGRHGNPDRMEDRLEGIWRHGIQSAGSSCRTSASRGHLGRSGRFPRPDLEPTPDQAPCRADYGQGRRCAPGSCSLDRSRHPWSAGPWCRAPYPCLRGASRP